MKKNILAIHSKRGALAAVVLLQAYGLLIFNILADSFYAIRHAPEAMAVMDFVACLLVHPIFIAMESGFLSELRGRRWSGEREPDMPTERWKAFSLIPIAILYAVLLICPDRLGFSDPGLIWTLVYQFLHPLICFALIGMTENIPEESATYSSMEPEDRRAMAKMFTGLGIFGILCALPPGAPVRTFLAIGFTLLVWGLVFMLADDFKRQSPEKEKV